VVHLLHRCRWLLVMMLLCADAVEGAAAALLVAVAVVAVAVVLSRSLPEQRAHWRLASHGETAAAVAAVLRCLRPVIFDYAYAGATITRIRLAAIAVGRFVARGRSGSGDRCSLLRRHRRWLRSLGGRRRRRGYLSR
jgi:glucose-6-phosphate-specific signal transduction histidine kinase